MKKNQAGFSLIEALLIVVVVGLVGGVSYYVVNAKQKAERLYTTSTTGADTGKPIVKTPNPEKPTTTTPLPTTTFSDVIVTDSDNGNTITLTKGQSLIVELASTYWGIDDSSNTDVVKMIGQPVLHATHSDIPGTGSGTVTATFSILATGTANITASRTTCGEALQCTSAQSKYQITVIVK